MREWRDIKGKGDGYFRICGVYGEEKL